MKLTRDDLKNFSRLGITKEILERACVERVDWREAQEDFGVNIDDDSGIVFPYYLWTNGAQRVTARVRRDHPPIDKSTGKEDKKYAAAYGDGKHLYFPPFDVSWNDEGRRNPIVFVEAEKSALALLRWAEDHKRPIIPVGLGGCYGWRGRIGKTVTPDGARVDEKGPLSDLEIARGRKVYVAFDSNHSINLSVQAARKRFVAHLLTMDCEVKTIDVPLSEDVNGPDDYIGKCGDGAVFELFENAERHTLPGKNSKEAPRLVVWDSDDFLAQDFPPRLVYMTIRGYDTPVLTSHSLNQIFATRGTGKSMVTMSLAGALSTGGNFLNFIIPNPLRVLYVDGELPRTQIQERMRMLHKAWPGARIKIIDLESQGIAGIFPLGTEQGQVAIERELNDIDVVIFDSIATLGRFDNLDADKWDFFNAWLIRLRSRGLCVITLHQAGKSGEQRALSNNDDPLDVQIKLERGKEEDAGHLKCVLSYSKMRGVREGTQPLEVEFSTGEWTYKFHEDARLQELEEFLCEHPTASLRKIQEALPDLGSLPTIAKLKRKLKGFTKRREERVAREQQGSVKRTAL